MKYTHVTVLHLKYFQLAVEECQHFSFRIICIGYLSKFWCHDNFKGPSPEAALKRSLGRAGRQSLQNLTLFKTKIAHYPVDYSFHFAYSNEVNFQTNIIGLNFWKKLLVPHKINADRSFAALKFF